MNLTTVCGAFSSAASTLQGEVPHRLLFSFNVVTDAIGTLTPRLGIANVCCTEQFAHESKVERFCAADNVLPLKYCTFSTSPTVPETWPHSGLRSGVQPS